MLSEWESFYVIVGSSGGALIGLQFVVITLIHERGRGTQVSALSAFGTPYGAPAPPRPVIVRLETPR